MVTLLLPVLLASPAELDRCLLAAADAAAEVDRRWVLERLAELFEVRGSARVAELEARRAALPPLKKRDPIARARRYAEKAEQRARFDGVEAYAEAMLAWQRAGEPTRAAAAAKRVEEHLPGQKSVDVGLTTALARYRAGAGDRDGARALLLKSEAAAGATKPPLRIVRLRDVAEGWAALGDFDRVKALAEQAKKTARDAPDARERRSLSSDLLHFGRMLVRAEHVDLALDLLPAMEPSRRDVAVEHFIEVVGYRDDCAQMRSLAQAFTKVDSKISALLQMGRGDCAPVASALLDEAEQAARAGDPSTVVRARLAEAQAEAGRFDRAAAWLKTLDRPITRARTTALVARVLAEADRCEAARTLAHEAATALPGIDTNGDRISVASDALSALFLCGIGKTPEAIRARYLPERTFDRQRAVGLARLGHRDAALARVRAVKRPAARLAAALDVIEVLGTDARAEDFAFLCAP